MAIGKLSAISLTLIVVVGAAVAQNRNIQTEKCPGPIYSGKDVAQRARIVRYADTSSLTKAATEYDFHGTIRADAVLCRSGRVTDTQVTQQLPRNLDEFVVAAIGTTEFKPAELNWHTVSQRIQFVFSINDNDVSPPIDSAAAIGRLVDELDIIGNRRMTKEEILAFIKTRPGDPYNWAQVGSDLQELFKAGYFDKIGTRVTLEAAPRGGVRVIFEVRELPLIAEISFEGPAPGEQAAIVNEIARQRVDLRVGRPIDPVNLKKATKVIEDYFRSQGWINVRAEASVENVMVTEVKVVFKITGANF